MQQLHLSGLMHGSIQLWSTSHSSLTQSSVLLVSTYISGCGPHWTDFELVRVDVQLILFGGTRLQTRLACGNQRQTMDHIVNHRPISNDFLVVCGHYIKPIMTLFHGWPRKASNRRRRICKYCRLNQNNQKTEQVQTQINATQNGTLINSNIIKQEAELMMTNPRNAFTGQSRSPNIVPFHMLGIISSCAIVSFFFRLQKCCDLEIHVRGHSRSLKVVPFDRLCTISY